MNADDRLDSVRSTCDTVAESYTRLLPDAGFEAPTDRGMIEAFVEHLTDGTTRPVVDAGCGTGRMTRLLASREWPFRGLMCPLEWLPWPAEPRRS